MECYVYRPTGVCSREMKIYHEDGKIVNFEVVGGCNGNLKGVGALLAGMKLEEVEQRLQGITCGFKNTSCPDQLSKAIKEILSKKV
ncbi:MAG: TIGR03905 family TSCPD domain-containing protein [Erysipelotrichales bacterium]|nr:TIGR03905 family TSCPD domain-containing protein [Erysipelotrichales bacterium]